MTPCPPDDRLRAFDQGAAPDDELDAVAAHLGACLGCVARLARLAVPVGPLSAASPPGPDDSAYRRAVARAAGLGAPRPPLPAAGDSLRDYRLVEPVGRGGMGTVFKAVHAKLDRVVAVKVLSGRRWGDPAAAARFAREMKAVGRLAHPNIVQATDAGDAAGVPFLVMEYVDGVTLSALVKRFGPRPVAEACALVRQAAAGLGYAHGCGLVHRDVKPSNLIRAADGTVKVLDLGLALPVADPPADAAAEASSFSGGSDLTSASLAIGTVGYMPPEQRRNAHAVDARADVYGLGATLWFLLTGAQPGDGGVLPGGLPRAVWAKLLAPDPADRFPDMAALSAALAPFAAPPRRRAVYAGAAALVAAAGVVLAATLWPRAPAPTPPADPPPEAAPEPVTAVAPMPRLVAPPAGRLGMTVAEVQALQRAHADHLGQPVAVPNSLKMSFVLVPPGAFEMAPRYHVTITKPYRLGATEVTRKQFAAFVKATGHVTLAEGGALIKAFAPDPKAPAGTWREPGHPVGDDMPVTWVSAADAEAMADYLTRTEGVTYRLPTEAEWRWACRAGAATRYPFGDTASELPHYATYKANTPGFPAYAGGRRPNAWGLFDMLGNVREWVADGMGPFPEGAAPDPLVIPRPNGYRVQCGGSFAGDPVYAGRPPGWGHMTCDCDTRLGAYWFVAAKDAGFRLCRDP